MTITTAFPECFKVDLLDGSFTGFIAATSPQVGFKLALFYTGATLGAATTVYPSESPDFECISTSSPEGYTKGGKALVCIAPTIATNSGVADFEDLVFPACSITAARGCMIYDVANSNAAVYVGNFGADKTSTSGTFTITFPAATAGNAILELA